jgi:alkaline phosphatase
MSLAESKGVAVRFHRELPSRWVAGDEDDTVSAVSLEDEHTAEEVPLLGIGPGSERIHGFMSNTDVFEIMMAALRSHSR